ncbi:hypothetical protein PROFUN_12600 [Planoprotostelium fungivorum]|uniref:Uncharacterized protein n=1 Tax=Planoprotostelium fungivorum TaxID=1890364 RepID=A0A2P6N695_9EUKA|nr:hypothetical protein PROFUN_12600 [Planoprotostelium fungivorum]
MKSYGCSNDWSHLQPQRPHLMAITPDGMAQSEPHLPIHIHGQPLLVHDSETDLTLLTVAPNQLHLYKGIILKRVFRCDDMIASLSSGYDENGLGRVLITHRLADPRKDSQTETNEPKRKKKKTIVGEDSHHKMDTLRSLRGNTTVLSFRKYDPIISQPGSYRYHWTSFGLFAWDIHGPSSIYTFNSSLTRLVPPLPTQTENIRRESVGISCPCYQPTPSGDIYLHTHHKLTDQRQKVMLLGDREGKLWRGPPNDPREVLVIVGERGRFITLERKNGQKETHRSLDLQENITSSIIRDDHLVYVSTGITFSLPLNEDHKEKSRAVVPTRHENCGVRGKILFDRNDDGLFILTEGGMKKVEWTTSRLKERRRRRDNETQKRIRLSLETLSDISNRQNEFRALEDEVSEELRELNVANHVVTLENKGSFDLSPHHWSCIVLLDKGNGSTVSLSYPCENVHKNVPWVIDLPFEYGNYGTLDVSVYLSFQFFPKTGMNPKGREKGQSRCTLLTRKTLDLLHFVDLAPISAHLLPKTKSVVLPRFSPLDANSRWMSYRGEKREGTLHDVQLAVAVASEERVKEVMKKLMEGGKIDVIHAESGVVMMTHRDDKLAFKIKSGKKILQMKFQCPLTLLPFLRASIVRRLILLCGEVEDMCRELKKLSLRLEELREEGEDIAIQRANRILSHQAERRST